MIFDQMFILDMPNCERKCQYRPVCEHGSCAHGKTPILQFKTSGRRITVYCKTEKTGIFVEKILTRVYDS